MKEIINTDSDYTLTISRLVLGSLFFIHGEGFEYHLLAIALGLVIVVRGSGAVSLDCLLAQARASIVVQEPTQSVRALTART